MSAKNRLEVPRTMKATLLARWRLSCRALELGTKPFAATMAAMRRLASSLTSGWSFSARETVLMA